MHLPQILSWPPPPPAIASVESLIDYLRPFYLSPLTTTTPPSYSKIEMIEFKCLKTRRRPLRLPV